MAIEVFNRYEHKYILTPGKYEKAPCNHGEIRIA